MRSGTERCCPCFAGTGGAFAPWRAGEAADTALLEKEKRGWSVPLAATGLRQGSQATVWTIPKSRPGGSVNLQCPPHRCSRFRSPV